MMLPRLTTSLALPTHLWLGFILALTLSFSDKSHAALFWVGDFETGDMSQWNTILNPNGITLDENCAESGDFGARITLTGDETFLWQGQTHLERSELHFRFPEGATREGKTTFFSFYFYLPKALSDDHHEIGYWESLGTYQQMFRFSIQGTRIHFQETAQSKPFWTLENAATPNRWHRISMRILWSQDPALGYVKTWVDHKFQGEYHFKTLPSKDAVMFTQLGLLRKHSSLTETICIDSVKAKSR